MTLSADDRTQVLLVSLTTEAQLLRSWMQRRTELAQKRREGPLTALRHRLSLLERDVPRLEGEVSRCERQLVRRQRGGGGMATVALWGLARGLAVVLAAVAWVVGVALATPGLRADDPLRLAAMLTLVGAVALGRAEGVRP